MDRPYKSYKENLKDRSFRKDSKILFLKKYIRGEEELNPFKLNENKLVRQQQKLVPGKIYTFKYNPLNKDVLSYYDTRPIILLHSIRKAKTGNEIVSGINLSFLPEKVKVTILDQFYRLFASEINKDIDTIWEGKMGFIMKAIAFLKNWLQTKAIFERNQNVNFSFAYRNYIMDRMKDLKVVEYDDWDILPFLESKEIMGESLANIYNSYKDSLIKKNK